MNAHSDQGLPGKAASKRGERIRQLHLEEEHPRQDTKHRLRGPWSRGPVDPGLGDGEMVSVGSQKAQVHFKEGNQRIWVCTFTVSSWQLCRDEETQVKGEAC